MKHIVKETKDDEMSNAGHCRDTLEGVLPRCRRVKNQLLRVHDIEDGLFIQAKAGGKNFPDKDNSMCDNQR